MDTKICFKCNLEKPISEFYKHSAMADGFLNKCKQCTKKDVHSNYKINLTKEGFLESERKRGRDKYRRLGYKDIYKRAHIENSNTKRFLKNKGIELIDKEIHHWNYNCKNDVFIVSKSIHKLIHKLLIFDEMSLCFKHEDVLLDTKEKHLLYIKTLEIPSFDESLKMYPEDF